MIRTSHAPSAPSQRPTRRVVARRLGAFLAFSLLAFHGVAKADPPAPPDSAFIAPEVVKETNLMAEKRYPRFKNKLKGYPEHKGDWITASTPATVEHKVDTFTKLPVPLKADVTWKGKSPEGIPYYFSALVDVFPDGKWESVIVRTIKFGEEAEK